MTFQHDEGRSVCSSGSVIPILLEVLARALRKRLETFFRSLELPEQSTGLFSAILLHQRANASLPPWPHSGLSMLEKHWIGESKLRIFRFSEVAY